MIFELRFTDKIIYSELKDILNHYKNNGYENSIATIPKNGSSFIEISYFKHTMMITDTYQKPLTTLEITTLLNTKTR